LRTIVGGVSYVRVGADPAVGMAVGVG
jgi:hypothetical protein